MKRLENQFDKITFERKSIRDYDETFKLSREDILQLLDEAITAPSSVNLQPWRFVVVDTPEGKDRLKPLVRFNTNQNETSAAMILIFGDTQCYEYGPEIYDKAVAEGKMPEEVRDKQLNAIIPMYQNLSREAMRDIVKIDASLVAMQLMLVARSYGLDTNPIGGFEADQLAEAFDLDPERYLPVMIVSIGKAKESGYQSVRLDAKRVTQFK